jgi:hypothetical protein
MLVQSKNGKFYNNPCVIGMGWHLKVTETDPIIIYFKHDGKVDSARKKVKKLLTENGINARVLSKTFDEDYFAFYPEWKLEKGYSFEVQLMGPIPEPTEYEGVVESPSSNMPYIVWHYELETEKIKDILDGEKDWPITMLQFLTNGMALNEKRSQLTAKKKILNQFEGIDLMSKEEAKEKFGEKITLKR